eukprot:TRINITY_DN26464_c0_g1_i2.p1 TRINITY_DN26464_c0_g1~~TRINITY_DN26464_c0_g1_i2.p1  ORF type:complete len:1294 (+),score=333.86 TRINITY_DN26464_c0_g1_i2:128-4009(+)
MDAAALAELLGSLSDDEEEEDDSPESGAPTSGDTAAPAPEPHAGVSGLAAAAAEAAAAAAAAASAEGSSIILQPAVESRRHEEASAGVADHSGMEGLSAIDLQGPAAAAAANTSAIKADIDCSVFSAGQLVADLLGEDSSDDSPVVSTVPSQTTPAAAAAGEVVPPADVSNDARLSAAAEGAAAPGAAASTEPQLDAAASPATSRLEAANPAPTMLPDLPTLPPAAASYAPAADEPLNAPTVLSSAPAAREPLMLGEPPPVAHDELRANFVEPEPPSASHAAVAAPELPVSQTIERGALPAPAMVVVENKTSAIVPPPVVVQKRTEVADAGRPSPRSHALPAGAEPGATPEASLLLEPASSNPTPRLPEQWQEDKAGTLSVGFNPAQHLQGAAADRSRGPPKIRESPPPGARRGWRNDRSNSPAGSSSEEDHSFDHADMENSGIFRRRPLAAQMSSQSSRRERPRGAGGIGSLRPSTDPPTMVLGVEQLPSPPTVSRGLGVAAKSSPPPAEGSKRILGQRASAVPAPALAPTPQRRPAAMMPSPTPSSSSSAVPGILKTPARNAGQPDAPNSARQRTPLSTTPRTPARNAAAEAASRRAAAARRAAAEAARREHEAYQLGPSAPVWWKSPDEAAQEEAASASKPPSRLKASPARPLASSAPAFMTPKQLSATQDFAANLTPASKTTPCADVRPPSPTSGRALQAVLEDVSGSGLEHSVDSQQLGRCLTLGEDAAEAASLAQESRGAPRLDQRGALEELRREVQPPSDIACHGDDAQAARHLQRKEEEVAEVIEFLSAEYVGTDESKDLLPQLNDVEPISQVLSRGVDVPVVCGDGDSAVLRPALRGAAFVEAARRTLPEAEAAPAADFAATGGSLWASTGSVVDVAQAAASSLSAIAQQLARNVVGGGDRFGSASPAAPLPGTTRDVAMMAEASGGPSCLRQLACGGAEGARRPPGVAAPGPAAFGAPPPQPEVSISKATAGDARSPALLGKNAACASSIAATREQLARMQAQVSSLSACNSELESLVAALPRSASLVSDRSGSGGHLSATASTAASTGMLSTRSSVACGGEGRSASLARAHAAAMKAAAEQLAACRAMTSKQPPPPLAAATADIAGENTCSEVCDRGVDVVVAAEPLPTPDPCENALAKVREWVEKNGMHGRSPPPSSSPSPAALVCRSAPVIGGSETAPYKPKKNKKHQIVVPVEHLTTPRKQEFSDSALREAAQALSLALSPDAGAYGNIPLRHYSVDMKKPPGSASKDRSDSMNAFWRHPGLQPWAPPSTEPVVPQVHF